MNKLENLQPKDLKAIEENQLEGEVCVDFLTLTMGITMYDKLFEYMEKPEYRWISINDCGPAMAYIIYSKSN